MAEAVAATAASAALLVLLGLAALVPNGGRARPPPLPGMKLRAGEWRWPDDEDLLGCAEIADAEVGDWLGSGWTKEVLALGPKTALKRLNLDGRQIRDCASAGSESCIQAAVEKMLKELRLLREAQIPATVQLLGYCVEAEWASSESGVRLVVGRGRGVTALSLLQQAWEERLAGLSSLAALLEGLGCRRLGDFRPAQFVTDTEGRLLLADLDDVGESDDAEACGASANLAAVWEFFPPPLLSAGAPDWLQPRIQRLLDGLRNVSAPALRRQLDDLVAAYAAGPPELAAADWSVLGFRRIRGADLRGSGDYACGGSRSAGACHLSAATETEAAAACAAVPACRGFVWTSAQSWTGRRLVLLKAASGRPSLSRDTDLYLKVANASIA